jgi:hypothetical protein
VEVVQILLSPCRSNKTITYQFAGETITATLDNQTETYDLSFIVEGQKIRPVEYDETGNETIHISTNFPFHPIISAKREGGVLCVELINTIGINASQDEKFPEWKEVV